MSDVLRPPALIGLTGLPGSGKTTIAQQVDSHTPRDIDESLAEEYFDVHAISMRQLLGWHGYHGPNQLASLRAYHSEHRKQGEGPAILDRLRLLGNGIFIVDSFRHQQDAEHFSRVLGGYIIALQLPMGECQRRYAADFNDEKHYQVGGRYKDMPSHKWTTIQRDLREDAWEEALEEVYDNGIAACMKSADVTVKIDPAMKPAEVTSRVIEHIRLFIQTGGIALGRPYLASA